jgi:NTP pyrophosphatase (non-canonical NTP hydrolase)
MHPTDNNTTIAALKQRVAQFVNERDWQQFHDPKSLSVAIALEAAELMQLFVWAGDRKEAIARAEEKRDAVELELVDILHAMFAFANACNIDLTTALLKKMESNARKYPIDRSKGQNKKYTEI